MRELEELAVSRETVRRLRQAAGIAPVRRRRAPKHRRRRLREARRGALVLVDASEHHWFGEQAPRGNLLGALDDATGEILALQFRSDEDLHGYTQVLQRLITAHGLPCSLYGDRLGVFVRNDDHWTLEEELAGQQSPTQFGQMLAELAIGYIAAHSPQAKGRIERLWETLQDRLVQELRLRQITTVAAAAAYLPEFIADHKRRFAQPARDTASVWRRPPRDLDRILACRYSRVVARDNTVTVPGRWIQIPPGPGPAFLAFLSRRGAGAAGWPAASLPSRPADRRAGLGPTGLYPGAAQLGHAATAHPARNRPPRIAPEARSPRATTQDSSPQSRHRPLHQ